MKKKKKLFALLLSLCLAITMLPMATATAWAEEHTNHCVCGGATNVGDHMSHPAVTWTAWNGTNEISYNDGNIAYVYLQQDTERSGALTVEEGKTLYLCLNGKTLTSKADSNTEGAITVSGTLYLCNCKATGGLSAAKNGVYVNVGGKFTQYNGNITGGASSGTGVFLRNYNGSGNFTMYGGTISGFKNSGVQVSDYGEFTMHNGTISGNSKSGLGGGVYVGSNAQFTMNDGTISQNNGSSYGGGVYTKGTFIMHSGKIEKNTSGYGGGVSVGSGGSFTMKNGLITKNSASSGGGVYLTSGSLAMNGGSITDNTATYNGGGIYHSGNSLNISGSSVINDNKKNGTFGADGTLTGGTDNNVYLPYSGCTVNIGTGGLTDGASIGVTTGTAPTAASPIAVTGTNAADYSSYFFADDSSKYHIVNGDNQVVQLALGAVQSGDSGDSGNDGNTEATHTDHCICGATHARIGDHDSNDSEANWTAWNQGANTNYKTTLPTTSGYYYLTENVEVSSIGKIGSQNNNPGVDIKLCLNGHSIVSQSGSEVSVQIYTGSTLTLTDCKSAAGSVTHSNQNNKRPGVLNYGTFNMYGGNITGNQGGGVSNYGTLNMYGGNIKNNSYSNNGAGVINGSDSSSANTATFNFYGGTISGNSATGFGGGVYNASKGTFNMSGTALIGGTQDGDKNTATQNGGGVCNKGTFNMTGGKILGNTATYHGGGVCNEGTFKISGDAQIGANTANSYGGGVYNYGAQNTFEMSENAVIGDNNETKGNIAKFKGGGIYHGSGVLAITGGTIKNNKANGNSDQYSTYGGGGIYNGSNEATNSIENATIENNAAQYGGGIYMSNASTLTLDSVTVKDNSATGTGSGLYISGENAKTTLKGDTKIIANKDSADKGNVYLAEYGKIIADAGLSANSRIGIKSDEGNLNKTVVTGSTDTTIFTGETAGYILISDSDGGLKLVDSSYEDEQVTPTPTPTPSGGGSWSSFHRSDNVINKSEDKTAGTAATTTAP